jgi:hypothetical protein
MSGRQARKREKSVLDRQPDLSAANDELDAVGNERPTEAGPRRPGGASGETALSRSSREEDRERDDDEDGHEERRDERCNEERHAQERKQRRVGRE